MAIPAPSKNDSSRESGNRRGRTSNNRQQSGLPNLKTSDVDFNKKIVKVIDAKEPPPPNSYNNAIILKIAYDGRTFLWNLKQNNPCFEVLYHACKNGANPSDWVNLEFYLYLETDDFTQVNWPRVELIKEKGRGK